MLSGLLTMYWSTTRLPGSAVYCPAAMNSTPTSNTCFEGAHSLHAPQPPKASDTQHVLLMGDPISCAVWNLVVQLTVAGRAAVACVTLRLAPPLAAVSHPLTLAANLRLHKLSCKTQHSAMLSILRHTNRAAGNMNMWSPMQMCCKASRSRC